MAMSAAQRRAREKAEYNAFLAECPSHLLLERISGRWVALVLCALGGGPLRYAEVARVIPGVSQKVLTQTLRSLEGDGLLTRTVTAGVPVAVTYELTPLGVSLYGVVRGIKGWAESHMDEILAVRNSA